MGSGRLFHKEVPMYDMVFCPVLVLRKGCKTISRVYSTLHSEFKGELLLKNFKIIAFMHW